jgi:hypothetical protein
MGTEPHLVIIGDEQYDLNLYDGVHYWQVPLPNGNTGYEVWFASSNQIRKRVAVKDHAEALEVQSTYNDYFRKRDMAI